MSNKKRTQNVDRRSEKKAAVLETKKKTNLTLVVMIVSGLLFAGGIGAYLLKSKQQLPGPVSEAGTAVTVTAENVTLPVALFKDGKARHYEYRSGDKKIRYFVLKSSDGVIRAAFDACDVCWPAGKGYFQEGDNMVCRNCGKKFASVLVNEVKGGCNPAPLDRRVEGGKVIIPIRAIEAGGGYFNFSKGV
jgi:uncharacterized membrane protein